MSKKSKAEERRRKAAEALAAQKRAERRRNVLMATGVVLAMVLIVGVGFAINKLTDDGPSASAGDRTSEYALAIGDEDAPRSVIIYEDFMCPACAAFEVASADGLERLAEEGEVHVSYRPFNLFSQDDDPRKPYSIAAAAAMSVVLEESGTEVATEFHKILFQQQPTKIDGLPDTEWLVEKAIEAGAEEADVRDGIESGAGEDWVAGATEAAEDAGIRSTPTILLDGEEFRDGRTLQETAQNLLAELE